LEVLAATAPAAYTPTTCCVGGGMQQSSVEAVATINNVNKNSIKILKP
jgi:hypothetical protein